MSSPTKIAPNLLSGILTSTAIAILLVLASVWLMFNYQVEQLVVNRTSEYAHSIAKIAADSSAEALLSEDILQLNLLVENVAKDPYISQAIVYSEDGQVVSIHPSNTVINKSEEIDAIKKAIDDELDTNSGQFPNITSKPSPQNSSTGTGYQAENKLTNLEESFIQQQNNMPFIEKITYQGVTAGWFRLEINRNLLENKFRESFLKTQFTIASIAVLVFSILMLLVFRLQDNIKRLVSYCQHLLIQNNISPPKSRSAWLNAVKHITESHPTQLKEHISLPRQTNHWESSRSTEKTLLCSLEFSLPMQTSQEQELVKVLTLAEQYLSQAVQSYGIHSQGDILTGCLIPFEVNGKESALEKELRRAIGFSGLIKKLMRTLPLEIKLKTCLSLASTIQLEDEHELITGLSVAFTTKERIQRILLATNFGKIACFSIEKDILNSIAETKNMKIEGIAQTPCYLLQNLDKTLAKENNLKFKQISQLN